MSETTLNEEKLDRYLFKCADIIRNKVDSTDYKIYILPLVFLKIISDTYQDRYEEMLEKYGDEDIARDPAFHNFQLPEGCLWKDLRSTNNNLDEKINKVFNKIEKENPDKLQGVFRANFQTADGLTHPVLKELIEHLSSRNLSMEKVSPDLLGEGYMDMVKYFATEEGRQGGEFFTPSKIVKLVIDIIDPHEKGASIYDPTCGSAGMLVEAAEHMKRKGKDPSTLQLYGQEVNPNIYSIAKMNIYIHNLNGYIEREDTLRSPQFTDDSSLQQFDYVVANFPFSVKSWGKEELKEDKYGRFEDYGMPPKNRGDFAFILHMVKSLNETGRIGVVVPNGVLFRSRSEKKIRKKMIEKNDLFEAVISLPENLFQNNSIPCSILVLNKDKPVERENKILFVHAADQYLRNSDIKIYDSKSNQNELTNVGIEKIAQTFHNFTTEEKHSRVIDIDEVKRNDYNLNVPRYVDTTEPEENIKVSKELELLDKLKNVRSEKENKMKKYLQEMNYYGE